MKKYFTYAVEGTEIVEYDTNEKLKKQVSYNSDGSVIWVQKYNS